MKYAKNENGVVKKYNNLPKTYKHIINFHKSSEDNKNRMGFYEVVEPEITKYQRLIPLDVSDFSNNVWTHRIHNFSSAEIEEYDERELDSDTTASKISIRIEDGGVLHKRFWDKVERALDSGDISENLYESLSIQLWDEVLPIKFGAWKIAKVRVDAIPEPQNAQALAILNFIKNKIDTYIEENY